MVTLQLKEATAMTVRVQPDTEEFILSLVSHGLSDEDIMWFVDWLLLVGMAAIKQVREQHPELTFADLIRMGFFRDEFH